MNSKPGPRRLESGAAMCARNYGTHEIDVTTESFPATDWNRKIAAEGPLATHISRGVRLMDGQSSILNRMVDGVDRETAVASHLFSRNSTDLSGLGMLS